MADLYSVIPGLQPSAQELLEAELLCKQILEAKYPDLDLREGTGLRDLVLRPSATLFALCKKATDFYFSQHTIKGVNDVTPADLVDGIMSNWFLNRKIGIKSIINARLYFARRKNTSISTDVYFSTDNKIRFFPVESSSYSANVMVYDSYSDEYYIDIDLVAEKEGTDYNIGAGSLLYFNNFDPYFLRAEINYLKSESINSETNLEFIDRAKNAISTRNLINVPSIDANLREVFNFIKRLFTVGMGDPEMIRDQIKTVYEDQESRSVTSLTSVGNVATVFLPDHGYNSGQRILVENVTPVEYTGEKIITVIDTSTFTYSLSSPQVPVSGFAKVKAVNLPILIHNGGMVDVYCSDKLATSIIQLNTNEFGRTELTGPIYSFTRSSITGGDEDDTIPVIDEIEVTEITTSGLVATVSTSGQHHFIANQKITISGADQWQTVTSLTSSGGVATATVPGHTYKVGNTARITGSFNTEYNGSFEITSVNGNNFTFNAPANASASASGPIKAQVDLINGEKTVTAIGVNSFTFNLAQTTSFAVAGTIKASTPTRYEVINPYITKKDLVSITSNGTEATLSVSRHGYTEGRYLTIEECPVAQYNGTWLVKNILNLDQVTLDLVTPFTGSASSGVVGFVTPWHDYGFSQKQKFVIDLGAYNANKTASFEINYFQNLDSIQEYLDLSTTRVLCADYLARGFNLYKISVEVTAYNGPAPVVGDVATIVDSYLKSLEAGQSFVMTDLITKLRVNGITNIQNPLKVTYKRYTRDLTPVATGTVTDLLDPNDRTSIFLLDSVSTHTSTTEQDTAAVIK